MAEGSSDTPQHPAEYSCSSSAGMDPSPVRQKNRRGTLVQARLRGIDLHFPSSLAYSTVVADRSSHWGPAAVAAGSREPRERHTSGLRALDTLRVLQISDKKAPAGTRPVGSVEDRTSPLLRRNQAADRPDMRLFSDRSALGGNKPQTASEASKLLHLPRKTAWSAEGRKKYHRFLLDQ